MSAERELTPAYYREMADEVREAARMARIPEVRSELLQLAERFERMAAYVKRRYPEGRDRPSPDDF
jgi:HAMP domain-containing protein